ncbi:MULTISPECIES: hypothetical protein [unclassified Streptomyces]|uniref:hypothetical protein n=1 Tax=unclassified Streptomyces TaxID=2593676 RepID=UPI0006FDAAA9|nr:MULTISPECIES: hypothetical protein [unclassified Streptomyces]KQX52714.1 hypothetical protein ASD33_05410 [Streptomyces sp. Root1304]KRA89629.1 hypothetical protein ASE09_05415 [Streptomyces sp. Root66D1]
MHADIHLQLHHLSAAELHRTADRTVELPAAVSPPLRVQLGWKLVELGLHLVTPAGRPVALAA